MKIRLIVTVHSFVDLITNSSSELFVCSTNKTETAIKEIIEKLHGSKSNLWETIFKEPEVADYTFDFALMPHKHLEDYKRYNRYSYNRNPEREMLEEKERAIRRLYKEDKDYEKVSALTDKVWEDWDKKHDNAELELLRAFLVTNGISEKEAKQTKVKHRSAETSNGRIVYLTEKFYENLGYGIVVRAGDIILQSARDNSIPYELMETIEETLNARRYHLG